MRQSAVSFLAYATRQYLITGNRDAGRQALERAFHAASPHELHTLMVCAAILSTESKTCLPRLQHGHRRTTGDAQKIVHIAMIIAELKARYTTPASGNQDRPPAPDYIASEVATRHATVIGRTDVRAVNNGTYDRQYWEDTAILQWENYQRMWAQRERTRSTAPSAKLPNLPDIVPSPFEPAGTLLSHRSGVLLTDRGRSWLTNRDGALQITRADDDPFQLPHRRTPTPPHRATCGPFDEDQEQQRRQLYTPAGQRNHAASTAHTSTVPITPSGLNPQNKWELTNDTTIRPLFDNPYDGAEDVTAPEQINGPRCLQCNIERAVADWSRPDGLCDDCREDWEVTHGPAPRPINLTDALQLWLQAIADRPGRDQLLYELWRNPCRTPDAASTLPTGPDQWEQARVVEARATIEDWALAHWDGKPAAETQRTIPGRRGTLPHKRARNSRRFADRTKSMLNGTQFNPIIEDKETAELFPLKVSDHPWKSATACGKAAQSARADRTAALKSGEPWPRPVRTPAGPEVPNPINHPIIDPNPNALHSTPCLRCWFPRPTTEPNRSHDDGLCPVCRRTGKRGINPLPDQHTRADRIAARLAFIAEHHPAHRVARLHRQEWRRAHPTDRPTIEQWVTQHPTPQPDTPTTLPINPPHQPATTTKEIRTLMYRAGYPTPRGERPARRTHRPTRPAPTQPALANAA